ncbi:uncharacterized protein LOC112494185 [Cephus cinctus]|uniref:Uncharacterized protein LOC112494185 n=1 Tax=Cephus cinctus TaxID=211228 RepID=A0AAJ7W029_CEPCN|nr:uncharacterized protein LOC112494185 [Cephus cinctus]
MCVQNQALRPKLLRQMAASGTCFRRKILKIMQSYYKREEFSDLRQCYYILPTGGDNGIRKEEEEGKFAALSTSKILQSAIGRLGSDGVKRSLLIKQTYSR